MKEKTRFAAALTLLLILPAISCAAPARPGYVNLTQPDGSVFTARLRGDEYAAWYETSQGYSIVQNQNNWWVMARERDGRLVETFTRADAKASHLLSDIPLHARPAGLSPPPGGPYKGPSPSGIREYVNGTVKVLVLLINFTDNPRVNASRYVGPYYNDLLFNHSNNMSMATYYWENSYGIFNVTGGVGGPDKWYTSAQSMAYYGADCSGAGSDDCYGSTTYDMICEAASLANPDVDYSQYDSDSDGYVDYLITVHAGCAQEDSVDCAMANTIWSVRWSIGAPWDLCGTTFDGKKIRSGTILAESSPMGTFGHEAGHDFGDLPDLYDIDYSSEGIGNWGMMSGGSWNGPGSQAGEFPAHFCAWSKYYMGWVNPTLISSPLFDEELEAVETYPDFYQIMIPLSDTPSHPSSGGQKEYFLVENRQQVGFDAYIPGSGVLIWHVDDNQVRIEDNSFNKYDSDRGVDLEEADQATQANNGLDGSSYYGTGDRGVAADAWKANDAGFTDSTTPNSKSKAGAATYINITNISASGLVMTADFLGNGTTIHGTVLLSSGNVSPQSGFTDETFNYTVSYRSGNDSVPSYVNVSIDGSSYAMNESDPSDARFIDGKDYYYQTYLGVGVHNFSFTASDGVSTNSTEVYDSPNVTVRPGYVTASLIYPNASVNFTRNDISNVTAQVTCLGGDCGNVTATINSSSGIIPEDSGSPFYTVDANPRYPANLSCLVNLTENSSCNVTWNINSTGGHDTVHDLQVFFETAFFSNTTEQVSVRIYSLTPFISNPHPSNNTLFGPYTASFYLNVTTHVTSVCRLSNTSGIPYDNMTSSFNQTNSTSHSTTITGLSNNQTLNLYLKCRSTQGYANSVDYPLEYRVAAPVVVLNEVNAYSDWIELFNRGETSVNLSSWIIEHVWGANSVNVTLNETITTYIVASIALNDIVGQVRLFDRDGNLVDNVSYVNLTDNVSYGRQRDGETPWVLLDVPSPGYTNGEYYSLDWSMFKHNPSRTAVTPENMSWRLIQKWNLSIGDKVRSSPAIVEGVVYSASWNGSIYALNYSNGSVIWNTSVGSSVSSSPSVSEGLLYVARFGVSTGILYCMNASTGAHVWNISFAGEIESSPLVQSEILYIGVNDGRLYAINASTGAHIWNYSVSSPVRSSPAFKNGVIYFGANNMRLYALDALTGSESFNYTTSGIVYSTPAVSGETVVFGSYDNRVYALNTSSGAQIWNASTSEGVWSSPAISDDVVYIGSNDKKLYALNLSSGAHIWNATTGDDIVSSPAVSGQFVFASSKDEILRAYNKSSGAQLWSAHLADKILSSPAVSVGMVFVGAEDGRIYAFGLFNDTDAPNITLLSPENNSLDLDGELSFLYSVVDEGSNITNCSLYLDGLLNDTSSNITEDTNQSFSASVPLNGTHNWSVSCTDTWDDPNTGVSDTWFFNVSIQLTFSFWEDIILGWNLISLPLNVTG
ncbi:MAG: PQQ-binding-like beta-propeller repeat protein [Candidatus Altiarchaeota archaeon]